VFAKLVQAVKRLVAYIARERVEVRVVVVQSRLSLVHEKYIAIWNKAVITSNSRGNRPGGISDFVCKIKYAKRSGK
jgi:hypothetical protein